MTKKTIDSSDLTVYQLFDDFHVVPDYQREYVWGAKEAGSEDQADFELENDPVYRLLDDVYQASKSDGGDEYFIGAIIVCPASGDDGVRRFELIDGQQRTTTLYVLLLAIRDALTAAGVRPNDSLKTRLFDAKPSGSGKDVTQLKLDLQYEDARGVLMALFDGKVTKTEFETPSARNIHNAYLKSRHFLQQTCKSADALASFYGYLQGKVRLVRIETENVGKALYVFETINERGIGLTPLDLLKNLMFRSVSPQRFDKLKAVWKEMADVLDATDPGQPMRFLRYFYLADYHRPKDKIVRENEIYNSFRKRASDIGYEDDALGFVARLKEAAKAFQRIRNGKSPNGTAVPSLENLMALGGKTFRQHYGLLLAGRHLGKNYGAFADIIEQAVTVTYFADVPSNTQERMLATLTPKARELRTKSDIQKFKEEVRKLMVLPFAKDFSEAFMEMCSEDLYKYRLKYLLARFAQYIEVGMLSDDGREHIKPFLPPSNNIEHILPQNGDASAYAEFLGKKKVSDDEIEELQDDWVQMLGNLTLLTQETNKSCGGSPYSDKKKKYRSDHWLMSRWMVETPGNSVDGQGRRFHRDYLETFEVWNKGAVRRRQEMLTRLAHNIWEVPLPKKLVGWPFSEETA